MSLNSVTPMGKRRHALGFTALQFASRLKAQFPAMTEGRLFRIETGRAPATAEEKEVICRLLNCKSFEIQI